MGFFRTATRLALLGGAAAGAAYIARKQGLIGGGGELPAPQAAGPVDDWVPQTSAEEVTGAQAPAPAAPEPASPEPEPDEAPPPTENDAAPPPLGEPADLEEDVEPPEEVTAEPKPADVADVVDDLLQPEDPAISDAEVVEDGPEKPSDPAR